MEASLLVVVIALGCFFSFTNGFQDGSSVAAGPVASRSLSPVQAVLLTALFEFLGALLGGSAVAGSIAAITSYPRSHSLTVALVIALACAIVWNFFTRLVRVPSSSTHALVGGLLGAIVGISGSGDYVNCSRVIFSLFVSPLAGFVSGYLALKLLLYLMRAATSRMFPILRTAQWLIVPVLAFGHGANDTQKVMGLIMLALSCQGVTTSGADIPLWVRVMVGVSMTVGVIAMAPGIVKRVGSGIYRQRGMHSFVSELSSALVVMTGSMTGGPVSASQVIASTVMGVGYGARRKGVHWLVAREMLVAWFLTIPTTALMAYLSIKLTQWLFPG